MHVPLLSVPVRHRCNQVRSAVTLRGPALHSDTKVEQAGSQKYQIKVEGVALNAFLRLPSQASSKIEPNVVMGPGRPGSVDKGSLEPRGERLVVSTTKAATSAQFGWEFSF